MAIQLTFFDQTTHSRIKESLMRQREERLLYAADIPEKKEKNNAKASRKRRINSNDYTISRQQKAHRRSKDDFLQQREERRRDLHLITSPAAYIIRAGRRSFHQRRSWPQKKDLQMCQFQYSSHQFKLSFLHNFSLS